MKRLLLLLGFYALTICRVFSANVYGGYVQYKHVKNNVYDVYANVLRYCGDSSFNTNNAGYLIVRLLDKYNVHLIKVEFYNANRVNIKDVNYLSPKIKSGCYPGNKEMSGEGFELHTYYVRVNLDSSIFSNYMSNSDLYQVEFGWQAKTRSGYLNTISTGNSIYISSRLVIRNEKGQLLEEYNTSVAPVFLGPARTCCNISFERSFAGNDLTEFDSIKYTMVPSMLRYNNSCAYVSPYSYKYPLKPYCIPTTSVSCNPNPAAKPARGFYFDSTNAVLKFTPTKCDQVGLVSIRINEYRAINDTYQLVGLTNVCQIVEVIDDCGYNNNPRLSAYSYYTTGVNTKIKLTVKATDEVFSPHQNTPDTLNLILINPTDSSEFKIIDTLAREKEATLMWAPSDKFRNRKYSFVVLTNDNYRQGRDGSLSVHVTTIKVRAPLCRYEIRGYHDINRNGIFDGKDTLVSGFGLITKDSQSVKVKNEVYDNYNKSYIIKLFAGYKIWKLASNSAFNYKAGVFDTLFYFNKDTTIKINLALTPKAQIKGKLFFDFNHNCTYDAGREFLNRTNKITFGSYTGFTNNDGSFVVFTDTGIISYKTTDSILLKNCGLYAKTQNVKLKKDSVLDIGELPITPKYDIGVFLSLDRAQRGFDFWVNGYLANFSSDSLSVFLGNNLPKVILKYPPGLTVKSQSPAYTKWDPTAGEIVWNVRDLTRGSRDKFSVKFNVSPTAFSLGDSLLFSFGVDSAFNDSALINNYTEVATRVRAAVDPNEKQICNPGITSKADRIQYRIDFQNFGNDTARNVVVIDSLSEKLDASSFEFISSSRPCKISIENRTLKAVFTEINLTDTSTSLENSKGYLDFSILPSVNMKFEEINNFADIYFDFENPVRTNTAKIRFKRPLSFSNFLSHVFCSGDLLTISTNNNTLYGAGAKYQLQLSSSDGSFDNYTLIKTGDISLTKRFFSDTFQIPTDLKASNLYRLRTVCVLPDRFVTCDTTKYFVIDAINPRVKFEHQEYCFGDTVKVNIDHKYKYLFKWSEGKLSMNDTIGKFTLFKATSADTLLKLNITGSYSCFYSQDIDLEVKAIPTLEIVKPDVVCANDSALINVQAYQSVLWSANGIRQSPIAPNSTVRYGSKLSRDTFIFSTKSATGCEAEKVFVIKKQSLPLIKYDIPSVVCQKSDILLSNLPGVYSYWYKCGNIEGNGKPGSRELVIAMPESNSTNISIRATDTMGCFADSTFRQPQREDFSYLLEKLKPSADFTICSGKTFLLKNTSFESARFFNRFFDYTLTTGQSALAFFPDTLSSGKQFISREAKSYGGCIYKSEPLSVNVSKIVNDPQFVLQGNMVIANTKETVLWFKQNDTGYEQLHFTGNKMHIEAGSVYKIRLINKAGCLSNYSKEIYLGMVLETHKVTASAILLYPNPSATTFTVKVLRPVAQILLYSADGREIEEILPSNNKTEIKFGQNLTPGVYTINVVEENGIHSVFKLLKQ